MKRLDQHISSAYIESANRLRPRKARRKVVAYVESYDDVLFWRTVLQEFETDRIYFEVMLPSRTSLQKGKRTALMNSLGPNLGNYMIACVDADYDWVIQGHSPMSKFMCENPYVLHTYTYAIENYQCYAPSLHTVCVMSTLNDRKLLNYEAFFKDYSCIIWPLFVWSVWAYRYEKYSQYNLMAFCDTISFHDIKLSKIDQVFARLQRRVNRSISMLQRRFPEGKKTYAPLRDELISLGVKPENCYLFIRGHTLMEGVVLPLLAPICNTLRNEREREIQRLAVHRIQEQNEWQSYQHSQMSLDMMLRKNLAYKDCEQYQWLRADIQRLIERITDHQQTWQENKGVDATSDQPQLR